MKKGLFCALALTSALSVPSVAMAAPVAPTNLDTWLLTAGALIAGPTVDTFDTVDGTPANIGTLTNNVYFNTLTGEYTYTHMVTPSVNNISEFNTGFAVTGFTGVAGFSFTQASAAGGAGTAADVEIEFDPDGTIDYSVEFDGFNSGEVLTFFFVSTKAPSLGNYNLINSETGQGQSFAPVPEPGSMALLGSGLMSLYGAARRRRKARA